MRALRNIAMGGAAALLGLSVVGYTHTFASHTAKKTIVKTVEKNDKYIFSPKKITVSAGTTITFTNKSDAPHTVTGTGSGKWASFNKQFEEGKSIKVTMKKAGTYKYFCAIHPYMKGTIVVK